MPDAPNPTIPARRIVVLMPNWLGDGVMATPFLRALRTLYPAAHLAALARPLVAPVCEGLVDQVQVFDKHQDKAAIRWLRRQIFDLGILLPNSFRSAWTLWRGRVKCRLGYARGGRSLLLNRRLAPLHKTPAQVAQDESIRIAIGLLRREEPIADGDLVRVEVAGRFPRILGLRFRRARAFAEHRLRSTGQIVRAPVVNYSSEEGLTDNVLLSDFQPTPAIDYYLALAQHLGSPNPPRQMTLHLTPADHHAAALALAELGITAPSEIPNLNSQTPNPSPQIENPKSKIQNLLLLVPGANFGSSKCWPPDRFAALAQTLADPAGPFAAQILLAGSPAETPICQAILSAMTAHQNRVSLLAAANAGAGVSIATLKAIVARARLMICNDTGPRHIAAAFGVPTVTLFGPTDPLWAQTYFAHERIVRIDVPCGPCQLKTCPIDHRCMNGITLASVLAAVGDLWNKSQ